MRSELRFDGVNKLATIRLTAESPLEQDTLLRWSNQDVSVATVVRMAYEYPSMTLRFADKVATIGPTTIGPTTMFPSYEPKPFRPTTADGPVPDGWREDCHGDLTAPDRSSVGYEPSRHHWFVCGGRLWAPPPKYFALRSEAVARLQELLPAKKPKPWCPDVGQWVRIKTSGRPAQINRMVTPNPLGQYPRTHFFLKPTGDHDANPWFAAEHLEPWWPRVGERVAVNRTTPSMTLANREGVVSRAFFAADQPWFDVGDLIDGTRLQMTFGLHELSPAPAIPSVDTHAELLRMRMKYPSVSTVGAEWRDVYPE